MAFLKQVLSFRAHQIATFRFGKGLEEGFSYIFTPIVVVLIVITALSIIAGIRQVKAIMPEGEVKAGSKVAPLLFLLAITAYALVSFLNASAIPDILMSDKIFPMTIALLTLAACLVLVIRMLRAPAADLIFADREHTGGEGDALHGLWSTLAWFASLLILSALLGFILALALFLVSFLRIRARLSMRMALLYSGCGIAFMCFMAGMLKRDFPPGQLQSYLQLPWPLN